MAAQSDRPYSGNNINSYIEYLSSNSGQMEPPSQRETLVKMVDNVAAEQAKTVLHKAIKLLRIKSSAEQHIVKMLIKKFPDLELSDPDHRGQTPLHMAVTMGNLWLVNTLLEATPSGDRKQLLLLGRATGKEFDKTVMMAQLPLSIAALTFHKEVFDALRSHGAELGATNSRKENICHSLIRYAFLYPEKLESVLEMCHYVSNGRAPHDAGTRADVHRQIWLTQNLAGNTPLLLAAKLGQHQIFRFIMELEIYCFDNTSDGLFDIKIYDVTEIDAISYISLNLHIGNCKHDHVAENTAAQFVDVADTRKSVLRMMLELEPECAFQFMLFPPLRRIIDKKWNVYRIYFYPWMICHVIFVGLLTWYGIERSIHDPNSSFGYDTSESPNFRNKISDDVFVTVFGILGVVVGVAYLLQEIVRLMYDRLRCTLASYLNPYSNSSFRVMFVLFALLLIADFFCAIWIPLYEHYCLVAAIVDSWILIIFFLRGLRPFSLFTVLIQKVLVGDMLRFFVIITIELLAFATAMHMLVQGMASQHEDFLHFGRTLLTMLKLMVGLGDIDILYDTRHPTLAVIVFVAFVVMTTLLMINSLIAVMSRTCSDVDHLSARGMHYNLQRLSIVLFIESVLPVRAVYLAGERYGTKIAGTKKCVRYMMEMRSLQNEDMSGTGEYLLSSSWGMRTAISTLMNLNLWERRHRKTEPSGGEHHTNLEIHYITNCSKCRQTTD